MFSNEQLIKSNGHESSVTEMNDLIHFLRTPLSTIKIGAQIIKEVLPILVDGYQKNSEQVADKKISELKLAKLDTVVNNILNEAERVSQYINTIGTCDKDLS